MDCWLLSCWVSATANCNTSADTKQPKPLTRLKLPDSTNRPERKKYSFKQTWRKYDMMPMNKNRYLTLLLPALILLLSGCAKPSQIRNVSLKLPKPPPELMQPLPPAGAYSMKASENMNRWQKMLMGTLNDSE